MLYPDSIEIKLGFNEIRTLLKNYCYSTLGQNRVDDMLFMTDRTMIGESLEQVREFADIEENTDDFPALYFFDVREAVARLRLVGTFMGEGELFDLRRSLDTICHIVEFLQRNGEHDDEGAEGNRYAALCRLAEGVMTFPDVVRRIDQILDKFGNMKDDASAELLRIRREIKRAKASVTRSLMNILHSASSEGIVEKDVNPTLRDGRLVIPVAPGLKRKIRGIVHDESASGKTVFVEPAEVVEANNRIRELESMERHEMVRILTEMAAVIRPHVKEILNSYKFLAEIDFIHAKTQMRRHFKAVEPVISEEPQIDWVQAVHPLLQQTLSQQGKKAVPLDVTIGNDDRMLIISGPNAGGKSVCLKTVGLLQYMLQCGLSVPVRDNSNAGIFSNIMIDIGDEQSIEDDLSTYSSHLMNMKYMLKNADRKTLILIDEFGTGTEPQIGGAIAEAVLKQLCERKAFGIITTHYQNLKHFASCHKGVTNGAMLYDRQKMKPLFQLQTGQPGSSFAIDIARKIGFPENVIQDATEIVGSDYVKSDRYLLDIQRDKRYWENKRQNVHQRERNLEDVIAKYEKEITELHAERKKIIEKARKEAEQLFVDSNKKIEQTIKEIKERQAESKVTKRLRDDMTKFKDSLSDTTSADDELIARKIEQIKRRKERKKNKKQESGKSASGERTSATMEPSAVRGFDKGDTVKLNGMSSAGTVLMVEGDKVTVAFGGLKTVVDSSRLVHTAEKAEPSTPRLSAGQRNMRDAIDDRKLSFKGELDLRGMRGDEALNAVTYFIDDAILLGVSRVRILHGKGDGILRHLIRQYLATVPAVRAYKDEDIRFGGAGITVVDL